MGSTFVLVWASFDPIPVFPPKEVFFCTWTRLSGFVLLAHFLLAVPLGLLIANVLLWLIPPARRALNGAEARVGNSFWKANAGLMKFFLVMAPFLVPIQLLAAGSIVCMSPTAIHYRAHSLAALQVYPLSQIEAVRPSCSRGSRGDWNARLVVAMRKGATFDLVAELRRGLPSSSPKVLEALRDHPWDRSGIERGCPHYLRKLITVGS